MHGSMPQCASSVTRDKGWHTRATPRPDVRAHRDSRPDPRLGPRSDAVRDDHGCAALRVPGGGQRDGVLVTRQQCRGDVDVARLAGLQAAHDELLPVDLHRHGRETGVAVHHGHDVLGRRDVGDIGLRQPEGVHDHRVTVRHVARDVGDFQRQLGRQALIDLRARHDDRRGRPDYEGRDRDRRVDRLGHDDRLDAARRIRVVTLITVGGPGIVCVNAHAGGVLSPTDHVVHREDERTTDRADDNRRRCVRRRRHAKPAIGASAASVIVHVFPVGMPVTVAGVLARRTCCP